MSVLQQPPDVLAGVAGHLNEADLTYTRISGGSHGLDEAAMGGLLALLSTPVRGGCPLKFGHRLLLVHGDMVAHRSVATPMIPP